MPRLSNEIRERLESGHITDITADNIHYRTEECNTPLHILLQNGRVDAALRCLRDFNANPFLFNDAQQCAFELAVTGGHHEAAYEMLRKGPKVDKSFIARLINDAAVRLDRAAIPEEKTLTLYALVNRLCGVDVPVLLTEENHTSRKAYLAHLAEFKGTTGEGEDLEGFFQEKLLPLRILSWLRIVMETKHEQLRASDMPKVMGLASGGAGAAEPPDDRQLTLNEVEAELLQLIEEALTSYLIRRLGLKVCGNAHRADYLRALASGVSKIIQTLPDNSKLTLPLTWETAKDSHAIYLSCAKTLGVWRLWLNNRGHGYNDPGTHSFQVVPASGKAEVRAAGVAQITQASCWNEGQAGALYIQRVIEQAFVILPMPPGVEAYPKPMYPAAQKVYYDMNLPRLLAPKPAAGIESLDTSSWPLLHEQLVGNCALANHDAAIFYGLKGDIRRGFFKWLQGQEIRQSGLEAIRAEVMPAPAHPYGDASTISQFERTASIVADRWQRTAEELQDYMRALLAEKYAHRVTTRLLTEDRSHRDYYVSLSLSRPGDDRVPLPCRDEEVLNETTRCVYVQGEAGTGKTTWCWNMAKRWAEAKQSGTAGLWADYDWVLLISLPRLQERYQQLAARGQTLTKAEMWELALDNINIKTKLLSHDFFSHLADEEQELYIFDGLDEVNVQSDFGNQLKAFAGLGTCIFTSRPHPFPWEDVRVQAEITLEGFSTEQRDHYVVDYLQGRSAEFAKLMADFPELIPLSLTPVSLEMLCYLIAHSEAGALSREGELTITDIYQKVFSKKELQQRWFYKPTAQVARAEPQAVIAEKIAQRMAFVECCATISWEAGRKVIMPEDIAAAYTRYSSKLGLALAELLQSLGILSPVTYERELSERQWEFPHRSIQEFFVATYYVKHLKSKTTTASIQLMTERMRSDYTNLVLPFVIGLLTRPAYLDETMAKSLCASIRTEDGFLDKSPSHHSDRLAHDILWFKCLTEIKNSILVKWKRAELLSWAFFDWNSASRLKASLEAARLLRCDKFITWAIAQEPSYAHGKEIDLWRWLEKATTTAIKAVVSARPDVLTAKTIDGRTVLHVAAMSNNLELARFLVSQRPALLADSNITTVLHTAARSGKLEIVQFLVSQRPALLAEKMTDGSTVLHEAVSSSNFEIVKFLVSQRPTLLAEKMTDGLTVLHTAARSGKLEIVQFLVSQRPALLAEINSNGTTVLHTAARYGSLDIVRFLVDQRPDLLAEKKSDGTTFLHTAIDYATLEIVQILVNQRPALLAEKKSDGITVLHTATAYAANLGIVQFLVSQRPALLAEKMIDGSTVLHEAARSGKLEIVQFLVRQRPALLAEKKLDGTTVLHAAIANFANLEIVKFLVSQRPALLEGETAPTDEQSYARLIAIFRARPVQNQSSLAEATIVEAAAIDHEGTAPANGGAGRAP